MMGYKLLSFTVEIANKSSINQQLIRILDAADAGDAIPYVTKNKRVRLGFHRECRDRATEIVKIVDGLKNQGLNVQITSIEPEED